MRCRARASVPAAAWHTLLRRGEASAEPARHWQLHETTSCRCAAAEPARRAACAGGKRGSSPRSAGPLRLIQKLPREALRLFLRSSSSSPARPPCTARLCDGISPPAPCAAGLCRCFRICPSLGVLRPAGGSGVPAGSSRARSRSGRAGVTWLSPRVPAPGAPADAAASGAALGGIAARSPRGSPCSPSALHLLSHPHTDGVWGVCAPERLGRCWQCDVGCRQQPAAPSAFCLGSCLRLVCHPAALRGVCCRLPPSEHPEGWDSFLYSPCPALCPSPPVSKQRRPPCAGSHCQG